MCGIFGIWKHEHALEYCLLSLHALQHRGQEGSGVAFLEDGKIITSKGQKLVSELSRKHSLKNRKSNAAIGHIRYATAGNNTKEDVQPLDARLENTDIAISHNGNLTNRVKLKNALTHEGSLFQSSSDTEIFLHLIAKSKENQIEDKISEACKQVEGAYSLIFLTKDCMIGLRDPMGFRPLFLGELDDSYVLSSETCGFELTGAKFVKEIQPGEAVIIRNNGYTSVQLLEPQEPKFCIFELIYFSRPDSKFNNESIYEIRKRMGMELSREYKPDVDYVIPVPDSGMPAALGYAQESGIPFELGISRNHYVGRTFIDSDIGIRALSLKMKHNPNEHMLKDKKILMVDDSIVRGSTSKNLIKLLKSYGVKEIHLGITSPPYKSPCFYGIDTPTKSELIASNNDVEHIREILGVDSIHYLSEDGLLRSTGAKNKFCMACFTENYPTDVGDLL